MRFFFLMFFYFFIFFAHASLFLSTSSLLFLLFSFLFSRYGQSDSRLARNTQSVYVFNIIRARPASTKPTTKPIVLSLEALEGTAGISVNFLPVLFDDRNRGKILDISITSYTFTYSNGESFEATTSSLSCDTDTNKCTIIHKVTVGVTGNQLSLLIRAKNDKGEGPPSIESTNPSKGSFLPIAWVPTCPANTCSSKKPTLAKPSIIVMDDLSVAVLFADIGTTAGSATPLSSVECTTLPGNMQGEGDLDGVLIAGPLDASLSYTITCTVSGSDGRKSLDSTSETFAASSAPEKKPTVTSIIATTNGMSVSFLPLVTTGGSGDMDATVTSYVLTLTDGSFSEIQVSDMVSGTSPACNKDTGTMTCSVLIEPASDGNYGVAVAAKNDAGTGPASIESTSEGKAPWPLLVWKDQCPTNTCSGILPGIKAAPEVWCSSEGVIRIVVVSDSLDIGSAAPYGKMTCVASDSSTGVLVESAKAESEFGDITLTISGYQMDITEGLTATGSYQVTCTIVDAGGITSTSSSPSLTMSPTTKPPPPLIAGPAAKTSLNANGKNFLKFF